MHLDNDAANKDKSLWAEHFPLLNRHCDPLGQVAPLKKVFIISITARKPQKRVQRFALSKA